MLTAGEYEALKWQLRDDAQSVGGLWPESSALFADLALCQQSHIVGNSEAIQAFDRVLFWAEHIIARGCA